MVYYKYSSDKSYEKLEKEARQAKRGLLVDKNPVVPWEWRNPSKKVRCEAITQKGTRCKKNAVAGSKYCSIHTK